MIERLIAAALLVGAPALAAPFPAVPFPAVPFPAVPFPAVPFPASPVALPVTPSAPVDEVGYRSAARNFLERHGLPDVEEGGTTIEALLAAEFLNLDLGVFEVSIPRRAFGTPSERERFQGLCVNLIDAQRNWLGWVERASEPAEDLREDLEEVREWIEDWDVDVLAEAADDAEWDAPAALEADRDVREALGRLEDALRGGALTADGHEIGAVRLALFPSRADFVEMLCVIGYLRPELQPYFWVDGIETWHEFLLTDEGVHGLAMAYPGDGVNGDSYAAGQRMDEDNPKALGEQIVQLALNSMLRRVYADRLPPTVVNGLAVNLVIEQFGEIDTRADGRLDGRSTSSTEVFVPGGRSEGGVLPAKAADNRWRQNHGRNHYLNGLRQAQKAGSKERGGSQVRHANFLLRSDDGVTRQVASAPFLGADVEPAVVPPALELDHSEFLRAYRIAFLHWLRTEGGGRGKQSEERFARWLAGLDALESPGGFLDTLEEVYERPLSGPELDDESLEGRFLRWLRTQRAR